MIQCQKCGHENPDDSKFCANCSAPLVGEIPISTAGSIPPPPQGMPLPGYEHQASPEKKKSPVWIWVIAGLVLFCSCGGVILAAILFPVFSQAKIAAKKVRALGNAKIVATGTAIYCADNDDVYPRFSSSEEITTALQPYLKSPSSEASGTEVDILAVSRSYDWNKDISGQSSAVLDYKAWMFVDPQKYGDKQIAALLDCSVKAYEEIELSQLQDIPAKLPSGQ